MAPRDQERARLRRFGLLVGGICAALALLYWWRHRLHTPFYVCAVAGPLLLAGGALAPRALRPLERAWSAVGHVLGFVNTHILLGVVFLVILSPLSLALRLTGRDPLQRRRDGKLPSYWRERPVEPGDPRERLERPY
jgi:MFS family permease